MPHNYVLETTHGDREFKTDEHHENHPGGLRGWFDDNKHIIKQIHDDLIQLIGPAVQLLAIYKGGPRGKGEKVTDLK